jgi:hypothetical protein
MLAKGYTDQPPTQSGIFSTPIPFHGNGNGASDTRWDYLDGYPRVVRALIGQSPLRHAPSWIQDGGLVAATSIGGRAHDEAARGAGGAIPQFFVLDVSAFCLLRRPNELEEQLPPAPPCTSRELTPILRAPSRRKTAWSTPGVCGHL